MYAIGDKVKLTRDAIENYGEEWRGKTLTIRAVYTHYCKPEQCANDPSGHPGFDSGCGSKLYGTNETNFDLYKWELRSA